jgi:protein subunit release factor A
LWRVGNPNLGIGASLVYKLSNTRGTYAAFDRQHQTQAKAFELMSSKLFDLEIQNQLDVDARLLTQTPSRSIIARTYNDRSTCVTDRSLGNIYTLDRIVKGDLDELVTSHAPNHPIISLAL